MAASIQPDLNSKLPNFAATLETRHAFSAGLRGRRRLDKVSPYGSLLAHPVIFRLE